MTGPLAGKATADRRHVDMRTKGRFIDAGMFLEPAEKLPSRRPGKRAAEHRFLVAGGLPHEQDAAEHGPRR